MITENITEQLDRAAEFISQSESAIAFTGAGISTDSGIPDFRSEHYGLWEEVDPLVVASIYGFRHDPQAFYDWVKPLVQITLCAEPNPAHYALAELEAQGLLKATITQNIDVLHTRAGTHTIYELHGHMREATCISCFKVWDGLPILKRFLADGRVPRCADCGGIIKPNVILFGEQLPYAALKKAQDAARKTDLLIVVGSSLKVAPASDIPMVAKYNGAKLIIVNLEPTPVDSMADIVIHERAAEILPEFVRRLEITG